VHHLIFGSRRVALERPATVSKRSSGARERRRHGIRTGRAAESGAKNLPAFLDGIDLHK
jgi:hypothetical protein